MATVAALQNIAAEITAAPHNNNYTDLRTGVNDINDDQINATADIRLSKLSTGASDEILSNGLENFLDGCWVYRVDGTHIGVSPGSAMINGKLRRITSLISSTFTVPTVDDYLDVWLLADSSVTTFTVSIVDSGVSPGGSANPGTNGRLIGSIKYDDATSLINVTHNYRNGKVVIWDYVVGDGTVAGSKTITYGVTFDFIPTSNWAFHGQQTGANTPTTPGDADGSQILGTYSFQATTTSLSARFTAAGGAVMASGDFFIGTLTVNGSYS